MMAEHEGGGDPGGRPCPGEGFPEAYWHKTSAGTASNYPEVELAGKIKERKKWEFMLIVSGDTL